VGFSFVSFHTHFKSGERNVFLSFWLKDFNESRIVTWQRSASWNVQAWKKAWRERSGTNEALRQVLVP